MKAPEGTRGSARRRAQRLGAAAALGLALASPAGARGGPGADEPPTLHLRELPGTAGPRDGEDRTPAERLCRAQGRVEDARRTLAEAKIAYRRMRRDDYPRGEPRELIEIWRTQSRAALAEAERELAAAFEDVDRLDDADDVLAACPPPAPPAPARAEPAADD